MANSTGKFVWFEHVSDQPTKAQGFYGELFNWTKQTMPIPGGGGYTMIALDGQPIGGYPPTPAPHAHWLTHLLVTDAAATAAAAAARGAKVIVPPGEMGGAGIYALISDPLGGAVALWQPLKDDPSAGEWKNTIGSFCWNELMTADPDASVAFYKAIGGFEEVERVEMAGLGAYHMLKTGGIPRAGVMKPPMPGVPQSWLPYVQVASVDASHAKATRLGATSYAPPTDIPGVGRFAVLADPVGASFGILERRG